MSTPLTSTKFSKRNRVKINQSAMFKRGRKRRKRANKRKRKKVKTMRRVMMRTAIAMMVNEHK